jgi:ABC-type enterochelin transport system permease subunit
MTPLMWFGVAAVAFGLAIGAGAMIVARRTAATREQAVRRQHIIRYAILVLLAAIFLYEAFSSEHGRLVYLALVGVIVSGAAFDWIRARRRRTLS